MAKQYQPPKANKLTSITAWHDIVRNRFWFLLIALFFAFGIIAYFGTGPGGMGPTMDNPRDRSMNDTVAVVNGENIARSEVENAMQRVKQFSRGNDASSVQLEGMMLGQIIDQAI